MFTTGTLVDTIEDPVDLSMDSDDPRGFNASRADRPILTADRRRFLREARSKRRTHSGVSRVASIRTEDLGADDGGSAADVGFGDLVGRSASMQRVFKMLGEVSPTPLSVLITGETGTGKELVARAIHEHSPRKERSFVVIDCTSIVGTLAESLLFGYERNAFTGADRTTDGFLQKAHGGTLFLDEIGELPMELQPKLLRALSERRVRRVGPGGVYQDIDVRVIAATHRDFGRTIEAGQFRADLYYRLAQIPLHLPPLRERREDIPAIVRAVCARMERPERSGEIIALITGMLAYKTWNGNVRELVNLVEAAASLPPGAVTLAAALDGAVPRPAPAPVTTYGKAKRAAIDSFEHRYFRELYEATQGNVSEMARRSGLERHHVRSHLRRLGIRPGPSTVITSVTG